MNDNMSALQRNDARADQQVSRCRVCATSTPHRELYVKAGCRILACEACGLGSSIVPPSFDPANFYDAAYFQGGANDGAGYADYLTSEPVLRQEFRAAVHALRRFGPSTGRLVEIGSAYGFFLAEAKRYYECTGVELSDMARKFAQSRGFACYHPDDPAWTNRGPFDAAVMLDTIEHLADPDSVLSGLSRVVRSGGSLMLTTGDWASMYARVAGRHWRLMTPPQHLYFYSPRTVQMILGRHGFRVIRVQHPWKVVPIGLALFQLTRRLGMSLPNWSILNRVGLPVNLFDAMRVIALRE